MWLRVSTCGRLRLRARLPRSGCERYGLPRVYIRMDESLRSLVAEVLGVRSGRGNFNRRGRIEYVSTTTHICFLSWFRRFRSVLDHFGIIFGLNLQTLINKWLQNKWKLLLEPPGVIPSDFFIKSSLKNNEKCSQSLRGSFPQISLLNLHEFFNVF